LPPSSKHTQCVNLSPFTFHFLHRQISQIHNIPWKVKTVRWTSIGFVEESTRVHEKKVRGINDALKSETCIRTWLNQTSTKTATFSPSRSYFLQPTVRQSNIQYVTFA
jgi:hypothetical protein